MADATVADRNTDSSQMEDKESNDRRPLTVLDKDEVIEEMLTEKLHRRQPFNRAAETTQVVMTTTIAPVKGFNGNQFLHTPYLGEQAVLLPVWVVPNAAGTPSAAAKVAVGSASDERTEKFEESKINEGMPTAQFLPPGANCHHTAEKKNKTKGKRGAKKSSKSDDNEDRKSDGGGDKRADDRKRNDSDDDEPRRRGYK